MIKEFFNGKEPNIGINPDEAVAYGAAIQAGMLAKENTLKDLHLIDVTPLSLGTDLFDGTMSRIIPRGTEIPAKMSKVYKTNSDWQTQMNIGVFEGEGGWL
jgi:endoplasmic reticulum chaperone BiP